MKSLLKRSIARIASVRLNRLQIAKASDLSKEAVVVVEDVVVQKKV